MSFRLYDGAWVHVAGIDDPLQAHKDRQNAGEFAVGIYQYDIDARVLPLNASAPTILSILSLQAMRERGLSSDFYRQSPKD